MNFHLLEDKINVVDDTMSIEQILKAIVETKEVSDPFHVLDIDRLLLKAITWNKKFPRVKPFYTVNCNDNTFVLQTLAAFNTNFNCTSNQEIKKVLDLGVKPLRIIISKPAKVAHVIKYTLSQHIDLMTFDNELELYKLKHYYPSCKLLIQISCDETGTQQIMGIKHGCHPYTEAPKLLRLALNLDLPVVGVSFHVGSGCNEPALFGRAIFTSRFIFNLAQEIGFLHMHLLNIGGGFPGKLNTLFDQIVDVVNTAIDKWFPPESGVLILAEPGTFFTASSFNLTTKILSLNTEKRSNDKDHVMYYINDGVYGSFMKILNGHSVVKFKPLNSYPWDQTFESSIWGPTHDEIDKLIGPVELPLMNTGDWIAFGDMGAYTKPMGSASDGYTFPKVFAVASEGARNILKNLLPFTEDHFTTVPIIGTVRESNKEEDGTQKDDNLSEQSPCDLF